MGLLVAPIHCRDWLIRPRESNIQLQMRATTTTDAMTGKYATVRKNEMPGIFFSTRRASSNGRIVNSGMQMMT